MKHRECYEGSPHCWASCSLCCTSRMLGLWGAFDNTFPISCLSDSSWSMAIRQGQSAAAVRGRLMGCGLHPALRLKTRAFSVQTIVPWSYEGGIARLTCNGLSLNAEGEWLLPYWRELGGPPVCQQEPSLHGTAGVLITADQVIHPCYLTVSLGCRLLWGGFASLMLLQLAALFCHLSRLWLRGMLTQMCLRCLPFFTNALHGSFCSCAGAAVA